MGERGDWAREHVLDPVMLCRVAEGRFERALDVGYGEGRFCRMLSAAGLAATGIDPTGPLIETARQRDPSGDYRLGEAGELEFEAASFDLVVSYLTQEASVYTLLRHRSTLMWSRNKCFGFGQTNPALSRVDPQINFFAVAG